MGQDLSQPINSQQIVENKSSSSSANTVKNVCGSLSNDHIAYITKSLMTILKAQSILQDVQQNFLETRTISDPSMYLIDTSYVLYDLINGSPAQTTLDIYTPEYKIVGMLNGVPIKQGYTCLDKYNDFFLKEYNVLQTDSERNSRAGVIIKELQKASANAISILTNNCSDIGKLVGQVKQPKTLITQEDVNSWIAQAKQNADKVIPLMKYIKDNAPEYYDSTLATLQKP
jgi:hypothetical protein